MLTGHGPAQLLGPFPLIATPAGLIRIAQVVKCELFDKHLEQEVRRHRM